MYRGFGTNTACSIIPIIPSGGTGPTGATGPQGQTGATGAPGVEGHTGATGVSGVEGQSGVFGLNGQTGATGTPGANGQTGATGIPGANGQTGATGLSGGVGQTGVTGPPGSFGPSGLYFGDYLYWSPTLNAWTVGNNNVTLGSAAGESPSQHFRVAIGNGAAAISQIENAVLQLEHSRDTTHNILVQLLLVPMLAITFSNQMQLQLETTLVLQARDLPLSLLVTKLGKHFKARMQ